MMTNLRRGMDIEQVGILIALVAVILGAWLRFYPVFLAGFPINDGGLFYEATQSILQNDYAFPSTIEYNGLHIPFAYPPLPFYTAAILNDLLPSHLLSILQWIPVVVLTFTLGAFYLLAHSLTRSSFKAGLSLLIYAFLPRSITWLIMGGGLTRSFGQLFLILTVYFAHQLFSKPEKRSLGLTILFGSLVVLSHPEAALDTAVIALVILIFIGKGREALQRALLTALGVILITAPWWVTVLTRHGMTPVISASQTGFLSKHGTLAWLGNIMDEPFVTFIMVLGFIGILFQVSQRQYLLPIWYIIIFFVDPRNAPNVASIPISLLASHAITDTLLPALNNPGKKFGGETFLPLARSQAIFLAILGVYLFVGGMYHVFQLSAKRLSSANQQAFEWVRINTPPNARFILITGETDLVFDWTQEWFPVLSDRVSLTTIQGKEWLLGSEFLDEVLRLRDVQNCAVSSSSLSCLVQEIKALNWKIDYIYIARMTSDTVSTSQPPRGDLLITDLARDSRFGLVYETEQVVIFKKASMP
jgi:hypothetical protein